MTIMNDQPCEECKKFVGALYNVVINDQRSARELIASAGCDPAKRASGEDRLVDAIGNQFRLVDEYHQHINGRGEFPCPVSAREVIVREMLIRLARQAHGRPTDPAR